jgi:diacylglycerol kinase family enzyme
VARSVDVVLNRNARRLQGNGGILDALARAAERGGARVHETSDLGDLERATLDIAKRGSDAVVLAGGDGSCMAGVTALTRAFGEAPVPAIAFAPAGTVGTIAWNVDKRRRTAEAVIRDVCGGAGSAVPWPTLRVEDAAARAHVGFIFGCGLVQRFFEVYDVSPRGVGAAAGIAARTFLGSLVESKFARRVLDPVACTATVDGDVQPASRYSVVVASVVRDVGLGLQVTYRAAEQPDRFHVVASGLAPKELGFQMLRVLAGRPLVGEPRIDTLAASLRVDFSDDGGAYVLDGELIRAQWASVVPGPVLRLLVGP